nr:hypothetical protein [Vampirovibrio sp.]
GSVDLGFLKHAFLREGEREPDKLTWPAIQQDYRHSLEDARQKTFSSAPKENQHSLRTMRQIFQKELKDRSITPFTPPELSRAQVKKKIESGLDHYRNNYNKRVNPLMKNIPAAYMKTYLYALETAGENTRYSEYRISPKGRNFVSGYDGNVREVMHWFQEGFEDAIRNRLPANMPYDYGLIVLIERHGISPDAEKINPATGRKHKVDYAVELMKETFALKEAGANIVGIDLAADELNCPVTDFKPAFDLIHDYNRQCLKARKPENRLGLTIHAGEIARSGNLTGVESIEKSIELGYKEDSNGQVITPLRIGHGLQLLNSDPTLREAFIYFRQNPDSWKEVFRQAHNLPLTQDVIPYLREKSKLLDTVIEKKILFEQCPKSNIQTNSVQSLFPDAKAHPYFYHPAVFLSRLGVKVALDVDNRVISNSSQTNEMIKLYKYCGATFDDLAKMQINAAEGTFLFDPARKQAIVNDVKYTLGEIQREPSYAWGLFQLNHHRDPSRDELQPKLQEAFQRKLGYETQRYADYWGDLSK